MSQINNLRLPPLWAKNPAIEEDDPELDKNVDLSEQQALPAIDIALADERPTVGEDGDEGNNDECDAKSDTPLAVEQRSLSPSGSGEPGDRTSILERIGDLVFHESVDPEGPSEDGASTANVSQSGDDFTLHQAASEGAIDVLKRHINEVLKCGDEYVYKEINKKDKKGYTPLHLAAMYNRKNCIIHLLDHGAKIDEVGTEDNLTPLHIATMYKMNAAAKHLILNGANVNLKNTYGSSALHFSARSGAAVLVEELLKKNANPNETDNGLTTPLHVAMLSESTKVTELLLKYGANIYAADNEGEMPIHYAAADNSHHLIRLVGEAVVKDVTDEEKEGKLKVFVNSITMESDTALHVASQTGYIDTVKTLVELGADINARTDTNQSALHLAAMGGHLDIVEFLIASGAKVTASDKEQAHPLHKACQFGHLDVIKVLLENKASINHQDRDNYTALMYAVWRGHSEVVTYLLEQKAKLHLTDINGKCVLHIAVEEEQEDMLELLLTIDGIDKLINATDKDFKTPLHYAARIGNDAVLKKLLANEKADVDICDTEEKTPLHIAAEAGNEACVRSIGQVSPGIVNATDDRGRTALHHAALNGHRDTTNCLIEMGSEISCRDEVNWTPLDYAAKNGFHKTIIILIDNEAVVDATDKNKMTPLHHASQQGHVDCIKTLLEYDADIMLLNIENKNCLELAIENFKEDACIAILEDPHWLEVVRHLDANYLPVIDKLIKALPRVAEIVLDKCIEYSSHPKKHPEYTVNYIYHVLDPHPDDVEHMNYFGPASMVRYKQYNLLSHPLTVSLIRDKWSRIGIWLYVPSLILYMIFVGLLTTLLVLDRLNTGTVKKMSTEEKVIPWILIILACIQLFKECIQLYILKKRYFKEMENYLEISMYILCIVFSVPFIIQDLDSRELFDITNMTGTTKSLYDTLMDIKWNTGAITIFLAWTNLLLYLKRIPTFGIHIVMFMEVLKTLLRVLLCFIFLLFAFSFSFYVLMDTNDAFKYPGRAIVKTAVMTIGEFEFGDILVTPYKNPKLLPYKDLTFVIFFLFLIVMPILFMNLLVGLAVGDIEAVRKQALIVILKNQVHVLKSLSNTYPNWILRKRYHSNLVYMPNTRTILTKIVDWFQSKEDISMKEDSDDASKMAMFDELRENRVELDKQKKHLKNMYETLEEHHELYQKIFEYYKNELNARGN